MSTNNTIYQISINELNNKNILINEIYNDLDTNYYYTLDFSKDLYIMLCKKGFISTSLENDGTLVLLPEIQFEYALLDFKNLYFNKKVKKIIDNKKYEFLTNYNINEILNKLDKFHEPNWLCKEYKELILELNTKSEDENFKINTFVLLDSNTKELVAGEIGYTIGRVYTSLTGFSSKEKKFNNYGKAQLVELAKYLEENDYDFWNLGHPYMRYKFELGAKKYTRMEFLERWFISTNKKINE